MPARTQPRSPPRLKLSPVTPSSVTICSTVNLLNRSSNVSPLFLVAYSSGRAALARRVCPRVHLKAVIVDGALLYLGSANWTGAGLGARGSGRRNFELGMITDDEDVIDQVQALYEHIWRGAACRGCKLRDSGCEAPIDVVNGTAAK